MEHLPEGQHTGQGDTVTLAQSWSCFGTGVGGEGGRDWSPWKGSLGFPPCLEPPELPGKGGESWKWVKLALNSEPSWDLAGV